MARRNKNNISLFEVYSELNEVFTDKIPTDYREINYNSYISYEFKTNSGTLYDLEFHYSQELKNTKLNNVKTLGEVINDNGHSVPCFDIAFTLSSVINKSNPDEFEVETNKNETIELMGRMVYIIDELIKKHNKTKLFIVGNSKRNRMKIYEYIFKNHFNNDFIFLKGESQFHKGESFFIIKK